MSNQKTIAHYLADVATDIKITLDSELSTSEVTRCIEKAVADFSRFSPLQKSIEITIDADVTGESFTTPTAQSDIFYEDALDISAISDGQKVTLDKIKPDMPRPVKITFTDVDESITAFVVIVKGYDDEAKYIEEYFYLEGGLVQTGTVYFSLVEEVEINEIAGGGAGDTFSVGTGDTDGIWIQLANKSIKLGSESISSLVLDTAYEMDYSHGRISMKSGGSMTDATAYTIGYTKSRIDIDLSDIIDDLVRVDRVEYPQGELPQNFHTLEVWGNILTLTGDHQTQNEATDAEHVLVRYFAPHSMPSVQSSGSFPRFIDATIQTAASAYALFILALKYEHEAATDLVSSRTELGLTTAIHALVATALGKVTTHVTEADTALAAAIVQYAAAATALEKVATYLENNTAEDSKSILALITSNAAALRTAIETATTAMSSYIDEVDTTDLGQFDVGAEGLLETGDGLINQLNTGANVPALYAQYSQTRAAHATVRTQAALAYGQEVVARISELNSYIANADAYGRIATGFVNEAIQRVNSGNGYVAEANSRLGMSQLFIGEAQTLLGTIDRFVGEADRYTAAANSGMVLADRFRAEAIERRNEAWAIWRDSGQYSPAWYLGQRGQYA